MPTCLEAGMRNTMLQEAVDFRSEVTELYSVVSRLGSADWYTPTQFKEWTINDVILHLFASDFVAVLSVSDPESYDALRADMQRMRDMGMSMIEEARARFPKLAGSALAAAWLAQAERLADLLAHRDPKERLKWSGPGMAVRMFATARQMETWAHGQEIYDVMGLERVNHDRIKNIAVLGVKTYEWSFTNRNLPVPGPAPRVSLFSPSGAVWEWGGPDQTEVISGMADEFCQVVTQVRNIDDTSLVVSGESARRWMEYAQCFAGPPEMPPPPGTRRKSSIGIASNKGRRIV